MGGGQKKNIASQCLIWNEISGEETNLLRQEERRFFWLDKSCQLPASGVEEGVCLVPPLPKDICRGLPHASWPTQAAATLRRPCPPSGYSNRPCSFGAPTIAWRDVELTGCAKGDREQNHSGEEREEKRRQHSGRRLEKDMLHSKEGILKTCCGLSLV